VLNVSRGVKIYLYNADADLRCGYDGLAAIVQNQMNGDPLSGALFIFLNRRRNRIKLLYWDDDGYVIWMKRLEKGSFEVPRPSDGDTCQVKITPSQLSLILDGIELSSVRRRRRFELRPAS
jgi:transposase